jgi:hypothetical protein
MPSTNLYRTNLDTLIGIKKFDSVYISASENKIELDTRYIKSFRPSENVRSLYHILQVAFYHFITLTQLPEMNFTDSSPDLNKLCDNEYRINLLDYLDSSLEGLKRLIVYYEYYAIERYELLVKLYNNVIRDVNVIRKNDTHNKCNNNHQSSDEDTELEHHYIVGKSLKSDTQTIDIDTSGDDDTACDDDTGDTSDSEGLQIFISSQPTRSNLEDMIKFHGDTISSSNNQTETETDTETSELICPGYNRYPVVESVKKFFFSIWQKSKNVFGAVRGKLSKFFS